MVLLRFLVFTNRCWLDRCIQFGSPSSIVGVKAGPGVEDCLKVFLLRFGRLVTDVLCFSYGYGLLLQPRRVTSYLSWCILMVEVYVSLLWSAVYTLLMPVQNTLLHQTMTSVTVSEIVP